MTDSRIDFKEYYDNSFRTLDFEFKQLMEDPHGFIHMTPELSIFAREVDSNDPYNWSELDHVFDKTDAWYVHLMCGSMEAAKKLIKSMPLKKYIVFQRGARDDDSNHILDMEKFIKKLVC